MKKDCKHTNVFELSWHPTGKKECCESTSHVLKDEAKVFERTCRGCGCVEKVADGKSFEKLTGPAENLSK